MTIGDLMTAPAQSCRQESWLSEVARAMRDGDYGFVPVIDAAGRVAGVMTDRDICLAVADNNRSPRAIRVHEIMSRRIAFARPEDSLRQAMTSMRQARVRRLPVVDARGQLLGVVSLDDLIIRGVESGEVHADEVLSVMRAMCERRPALVRASIAAA